MNSCLISSVNEFADLLIDMCDESFTMDLIDGSIHIQNAIQSIIDDARKSPNPESQLAMFRKAIEEFYGGQNVYSNFIKTVLPLGNALVLFNPKYNQTLDENKTVSSTFEETAKSSRITRSRNFLDSKFKDAPNAKLYFRRSIRNDMVETFLVRRSGSNPQYFTSQEEMNANVRIYKQELLDRVFDYFDNVKSKPA